MVREITDQKRCDSWGVDLSAQWIGSQTPVIYYVDGHVQFTTALLPFFFVTAEVNERMIEMLEGEIIPRLLELHPVDGQQQALMEQNPDYPVFTLVFDREGYSPAFFKRLWDEHRIAVITYRKNVKDSWDEALFSEREKLSRRKAQLYNHRRTSPESQEIQSKPTPVQMYIKVCIYTQTDKN